MICRNALSDVSLSLYISNHHSCGWGCGWGCLLPLTHLMTYYGPRWDLTQAVQAGSTGATVATTLGRNLGRGREGGRGGELPPASSHTDTDIIMD